MLSPWFECRCRLVSWIEFWFDTPILPKLVQKMELPRASQWCILFYQERLFEIVAHLIIVCSSATAIAYMHAHVRLWELAFSIGCDHAQPVYYWLHGPTYIQLSKLYFIFYIFISVNRKCKNTLHLRFYTDLFQLQQIAFPVAASHILFTQL